MVNGQEFLNAIYSIADEKRIDKEIVLQGVTEGFQKAYEKFFDPDAVIKVEIDEKNGEIKVFKELTVVDELDDDLIEIVLKEAQEKFGKDTKIGDKVYELVTFDENFSRLAIIHVGQIIKQKIREGEKQKVYEEFSDKEHKMIYGEVKDITETSYLVSVNGSIIPIWNKKMIPGESFNIGQRISFYVENISKDDKHSQVQGTRVHPMFLRRLLESEIREIIEGIVEIKSVSREPGKRAKIAVYSHDSSVDPIGACVGAGGQRIKSITNQLNGEKIDVILWNEDKEKFIINAMAPVRVASIELDEENEECTLVVPNEQLSLAIGRHGVTSKLVANLIGLKVNIVSVSDSKDFGIEVLWNGNITEEELKSTDFLQNVKMRREKSSSDQNKRFEKQNNFRKSNEMELEEEILDESSLVQDSSISEIQENMSAFENISKDSETENEYNEDLEEEYDKYYE